MNPGAGRLGGFGGFNRVGTTHYLGAANHNVLSNRMNAWNRMGPNGRTVVNNQINNFNYLHAGWHRGNWGGYGGYGYGYGPGLFGSGLLWGLGTGLGFGLGSGLFWGLGYGGWGYGGWGGYGGYGGYGGGLLGWGLPAWWLGTWPYDYGYYSYTNPYYAAIQPMVANPVYDYSQPIPVDTSTPPPQTAVEAAKSSFDAALAAFKSGDYDTALREIDQAIKELPNDPDLHEFRALTLFALGRDTESAAVLYSVLSVKPGWNWATLIGFYPDVDTFTAQLRKLERYCGEHPNEAPPRFVLAYLYMTMGAADAAADQLRAVVELQPDDRLSAQLLADLTATSQADSTPPNPEPSSSGTSTTSPPPPSDLTGTWRARGAVSDRRADAQARRPFHLDRHGQRQDPLVLGPVHGRRRVADARERQRPGDRRPDQRRRQRFQLQAGRQRTRRSRVDLHPLMNRSSVGNPDSPIGPGVTRSPGGKRGHGARSPFVCWYDQGDSRRAGPPSSCARPRCFHREDRMARQDDLMALVQRVSRLERPNRRLRQALLGIPMLALLLIAASTGREGVQPTGQAAGRVEKFDEITVGRINIAGPDGVKRLILAHEMPRAPFQGERFGRRFRRGRPATTT